MKISTIITIILFVAIAIAAYWYIAIYDEKGSTTTAYKTTF